MNKDRASLIEKLFASDTDDVKIVRGIFDLARREEDIATGRRVRNLAAEKTRAHRGKPAQKEFMELYWDIMLWLAPNDFDSFLLYIERLRKPQDRFYQPRRKQQERYKQCNCRQYNQQFQHITLPQYSPHDGHSW